MFLTDEEKRMRDGAEGDAVAAAMDLLLRYGYALDAERLCDIRNVAGTMTQPTPRMRDAMAHAVVGDEQYGEDPTVLELERRAAERHFGSLR